MKKQCRCIAKTKEVLTANGSLILKPYTPGFKFDQPIMCKVPAVWVTFLKLQLSFCHFDQSVVSTICQSNRGPSFCQYIYCLQRKDHPCSSVDVDVQPDTILTQEPLDTLTYLESSL